MIKNIKINSNQPNIKEYNRKKTIRNATNLKIYQKKKIRPRVWTWAAQHIKTLKKVTHACFLKRKNIQDYR